MRRISAPLFLRLCLLLAIVASAVLVVDYANVGDPAFCGSGSGCMAVRLAPVTRTLTEIFHMPLPSFGLTAFVISFGVALYAHKRTARLVLAGLCLAGGLIGAVLLSIQAHGIGAFCPWCVTVDVSAILAGGAAVLSAVWAPRLPDGATEALFSPKGRIAWSVLGVAAVALPFAWGAYPVVPPAPADIAAQQVPGKLTIVEFTDFECPYCRMLNPVLEEVRAAHPDRVALVRRMKPLSFHVGARPAALAYLCAPEQKRDAVAQGLYEVDESELTPKGVVKVAERAGLDGAAVAKCMDSPEAEEALASDEAMFERLGAAGLPRTYVGDRLVMGFNPDRLRSLVARELEGEHPELPVWAMFAVLAAGYAAGCWGTLRRARRFEAAQPKPAADESPAEPG